MDPPPEPENNFLLEEEKKYLHIQALFIMIIVKEKNLFISGHKNAYPQEGSKYEI